MDPDLKPLRTEGVNWRLVEDEGFLLDPDTGRHWALNPVGVYVWDLCDGRHDVARIVGAVSRQFRVPLDIAAADVDAFLLDLEDQQLLSLRLPEAC